MERKNITQTTIDRYISGKASLEEMAQVTLAMKEDPNFRELIKILEDLHRHGSLSEDLDQIPMASMAAMSQENLCDVMCEQFILRDYIGAVSLEDCHDIAQDNCWLKDAGMPLHHMGRLLEQKGMSVSRRYDCSPEDLAQLLSQKYKVIAVVDYGRLWNKEADGIFHAIVCLNITDGIIRIYDPAADGQGNYRLNDFVKAWKYSKNYLVIASPNRLVYHPHPIDASEVELDEQLMELSEAIAENAHEVWAYKRQKEGWTFGPERNDALKQHPDMVPYSELTEGEKYYDRDMAMGTLRLVRKLGFEITRRNTAYCPHCGEFVATGMHFCPNCGKELPQDFM